MSPYFAVIRDSFHAALASRVLWIAFLAIWLLLAALAPIGYREDFTTTFRGQDFHNGTRMKAMLAQGLADPDSKDKPIGRIAAVLPEELRRQLGRVGAGDEIRIRYSVLSDALNECLDDEKWYDEEAWESTLRFKELRELDELTEDEMDESIRRRRARLRIEAAMPGVFETRASRSIILTYAGMDFPANLAVDKTQFVTLINQWVVPVIIDWLLGFVLVFLGILVTASVIPDMLQPGSLHLLLSKPVSRSLLFLSKFIGGCAFVLLCVIQLVVGLYLVAGLRLDVWNLRFLWCIPVSVFLFSVFYSVSAVAGLRWRSPILAIGVTTIFGSICLVTGIIGGLFDGLVSRPDRIRGMAVAGETVFGATQGGGLVRFDKENNEWAEVFESSAMSPDRVLSPVALDDQIVITARVRGGRFNPFGSGALDLLVLSETDEWNPEPSLRLPAATSSLYAGGDSVIAMNTGELAMTDEASIREAAGQKAEDEEGKGVEAEEEEGGWLSKLSNMMGGATTGFQSILPERMALTPPRGIVLDADGNGLIAMSRGRLVRLERPADDAAGRWTLAAERTLDGEASLDGVIAVSGTVIAVSREEEPVLLFDLESLETLAEVELPSRLIPTGAAPLGDNRFALVTSDGRCRVISPANQDRSAFDLSSPSGPSEVESVHLDRKSGMLFVAHHVDRVDAIQPSDFSVQREIRPSLKRWRLVDKFIIAPLRLVIPQTGELGETIAAMVSGKSAISFDDGSGEEQLERYNIARPVASCSIFILVMLTIGCVYFATRDF